jgi:uncharacterized protein (TIGR02145 family)
MRQVDASTFTTMKKLFVKAVLLVITSLAAVACTSCSNKGDEAVAPVVGSAVASNITATSAMVTVTIKSDGGSPIVKQGVVNGLNTYMSSDFNSKTFSTSLSNLSPNTNYTIRGFATNSIGTGYSDVQFVTAALPTITDFDGNKIPYGTIGNQTWTFCDLAVTHYNNGDPIVNITINSIWASTSQGAMCYYNNDSKNKSVIYNYYAAIDPRGIAPKGWHVATHADWVALANYLGGNAIAGGFLKQTGTTNWKAPNTGATNSTGFTALPTGTRDTPTGEFLNGDGLFAAWIAVDKTPGNIIQASSIDARLETPYFYTANLGAAIRLVEDN